MWPVAVSGLADLQTRLTHLVATSIFAFNLRNSTFLSSNSSSHLRTRQCLFTILF